MLSRSEQVLIEEDVIPVRLGRIENYFVPELIMGIPLQTFFEPFVIKKHSKCLWRQILTELFLKSMSSWLHELKISLVT